MLYQFINRQLAVNSGVKNPLWSFAHELPPRFLSRELMEPPWQTSYSILRSPDTPTDHWVQMCAALLIGRGLLAWSSDVRPKLAGDLHHVRSAQKMLRHRIKGTHVSQQSVILVSRLAISEILG